MCDGLKFTASAPAYAPDRDAASSSDAALAQSSSSDAVCREPRAGGRESRSCMSICVQKAVRRATALHVTRMQCWQTPAI
jgi:hypothetical protein